MQHHYFSDIMEMTSLWIILSFILDVNKMNKGKSLQTVHLQKVQKQHRRGGAESGMFRLED